MEQKFKRSLNFAIKVNSEKSERPSSIINYLPHHGVRNINKPGRIRVVSDAVAVLKVYASTTTS